MQEQEEALWVWKMCVAKAKAVTKHVRLETGRRRRVAPYLANRISFHLLLVFLLSLSLWHCGTVLVRLWPHLSATIPFAPHSASHFAGSCCQALLAWQIAIKISSATKYATLKFVQNCVTVCVCMCVRVSECVCLCRRGGSCVLVCVRHALRIAFS